MTTKQRVDVYMLGFGCDTLPEFNTIQRRFNGMGREVEQALLDGFLDSLTDPQKRSVVLD